MGNLRLVCVGALLLRWLIPLITSLELEEAIMLTDVTLAPKYDRIEEAERACEGVIASASELKPNGNWVYSISRDLSFTNGDWNQETSTTRPLLPFVDAISFNKSTPPFMLSTFSITDVKYAHQSKNAVRVNGVLDLVITRNGPLPKTESRQVSSQFEMWKGHTGVSVFFQGLYTESEENGGERVMCLLGSAILPSRQSDSADPWGHIKSSDPMYYDPPMLTDDQILLVLHYPLRFSLTQRKIQGEMRSLSSKTELKYFEKVQILSQLTTQEYKFGSQPQAVRKACDPKLDDLLGGGVDIYKGHEFCSIFEAFKRRSRLDIRPNRRCSGSDEFCNKVGPFVTDGKERRSSHDDAQLLMQNLHCEQKQVLKGNVTVAKVSLVLRLAPSHENMYIEMKRSGLGNMTVAAEGGWNSSTGQLCMVGCLNADACDSRLCFYISTTFSITQRSPLLGSISSTNDKTSSYFPLSFQFPVRFRIPRYLVTYSNLRYNYSKIDSARALLEKHESSSLGKTIKTSLLKYPRMRENEDSYSSSLLLAEDLTFYSRIVPDPSRNSEMYRSVSMSLLTLDSIFNPYSRRRNFSYSQVNASYHEKAAYTEKQLLVNVSAQILITGETDGNFSSLSVEGLYDAVVGRMYMIGCRQVLESHDYDGGFDCSTEVIISYPAVTAQWLLNPAVEISIRSTRPEDDPLYFIPATLRTRPITYRRQREDAISEEQLETVLRFLTLSVAIACILLQLFYIKNAPDSVAYISLVMLSIQALGYGIPLITGVEALFGRKNSETELMSSPSELYNAIGFGVKLMVLTAFLLTLRLLQKVWKGRVRLLRQQLCRVPNDKIVLLCTSVMHALGFVCALYFHEFPNMRLQWTILVEEYTGIVQDLFLFPQVVGNLVWPQIESQPVRKMYYIGISVVRVVPHVYDYFKASTQNPYFSREYVFVNRDTDLYSKLSDIVIPVMTALLALLLYVQQRWSYVNAIAVGLLPLRPKPYQKLAPQSLEAELADQEP